MTIKQGNSTKNKPRTRKVRFSIAVQDARQVAVAGDFNQWDRKCYCVRKRDGRWEKTLSLPPGEYEYKYLVDGQWRMDPANARDCINCYGTRNNVLVVPSK